MHRISTVQLLKGQSETCHTIEVNFLQHACTHSTLHRALHITGWCNCNKSDYNIKANCYVITKGKLNGCYPELPMVTRSVRSPISYPTTECLWGKPLQLTLKRVMSTNDSRTAKSCLQLLYVPFPFPGM